MARNGAGLYSILAPTDDGFAVGNGTFWQVKVMPNCRPSLGQGWSYDNATNTLACETVVTAGGGLTLTEDADSVNSPKAIEIGLTPFVSYSRRQHYSQPYLYLGP